MKTSNTFYLVLNKVLHSWLLLIAIHYPGGASAKHHRLFLWEDNKSHRRQRVSLQTCDKQGEREENKPRGRVLFGAALKFSLRGDVR